MNIISLHWQQTIPIRHQVLWPDHPPHFCYVEGDETARHFGVEKEGTLISVASLFRQENKAQLRKFATLPRYQGQGIGSRLLKHVMTAAQEDSTSYFWCRARITAVPFYGRFGLVPDGQQFERAGVTFIHMGKHL